MNHRQQILFLGFLFLGSMSHCDVVSAQWLTSPFFFRKPHEIAPQKYRKQNDGTIYERKTGDIYDRKGNLLRRGNGTSYTTPNNYPSEPAIKENNYEAIIGVGVKMRQDEKARLLIVDDIIQGSPAASIGILPRDVITQIDSLSTSSMTVEQAMKLIRGSIGTQVTLKVLRNGQPLKFTMKRTRLLVQSR